MEGGSRDAFGDMEGVQKGGQGVLGGGREVGVRVCLGAWRGVGTKGGLGSI
jgi:hypothetical protein